MTSGKQSKHHMAECCRTSVEVGWYGMVGGTSTRDLSYQPADRSLGKCSVRGLLLRLVAVYWASATLN